MRVLNNVGLSVTDIVNVMTDVGLLLLGAYLLTVLWSGQHVHGSPFKISVMSTSDASKVVCSGDGLTNIVLGREGSVLVDTRTAGPGLYSVLLC